MKLNYLYLIVIALAIIGIFSTMAAYSKNEEQTISISGFAINDEQDTPSKEKVFFIGIFLSLAASLSMNVILLGYARKMMSSLTMSNKRINEEIKGLKSGKYDEIKEVVMTRNMLLNKLENKK